MATVASSQDPTRTDTSPGRNRHTAAINSPGRIIRAA